MTLNCRAFSIELNVERHLWAMGKSQIGSGGTVGISAGCQLRAAADERLARQRWRPQTQLGGPLYTHQLALDKRGGLICLNPYSLMTHNKKIAPQVPGIGSSRADAETDIRQTLSGTTGPQNPRVGSLCQTTKARLLDSEKFYILTLNTRTLRTEERITELEYALENINWDIIGLAEVRRDGEDTLERSANTFYFSGGTNSRYGVGFLVSKKWKDHILEFKAYSDRIAVLRFRIADKKTLAVVQVYAPTSSHSDEEVEEFYDLLNKACDENRATWTIVQGDFNAKVGASQELDYSNIVGPHGLGLRNERGTRLLQFAFGQNLSLANSYFYKKPHRRWTWLSPDKVTKNEIDYCLPSHKELISNVEVLNNFKFSSDHRPLRTTLKFSKKIERVKIVKNSIRRLNKATIIANQEQFNLELKNCFSLLDRTDEDDVQTQYSNIKNSIKKVSNRIKTKKYKESKLSYQTKQLIEDRQQLAMYTPEHKEVDRLVKRSIRKDLRNRNTHLIKIALEQNTSLKSAKQGISSKGRPTIACLKDSAGVRHNDRDKILNICTEFYKNLYSEESTVQPIATVYSCSDNISPFTGWEVHKALRSMKYSKSPGDDGLTTEALKIGEPVLLPHVTNLFNSILKSGFLPRTFCHSLITLLHKKGDKTDINNYRPISLVSHLYKAFIKVIENRIAEALDKHQPPEQAGFRRGLSTIDHLHSINQVVEKHTEFQLPLYIAFVDYTKAFDSISHTSIFNALQNQEIDSTYINLLQNIYRNSTAAIKISSKTGPSFQINKGVKQGDPLSPKLFTAVLEDVFRKLAASWAERGIMVGHRRLSNLRFADDIVLFSSSVSELTQMLEDLSTASLEVGLQMNMSKTKLMTNSVHRRITVAGGEVKYVDEYLYLGQIVSFQARQNKEVARRTENAWKSYWAMKDLMKGDLPLSLKRRLIDVCILPILTYGSQTWSLTIQQRSTLEVCQRAMERSILGIKLVDRVKNTTIRSITKIADVTRKAATLKWNWAGHICRMSDDQWPKLTTQWVPLSGKRHRGRPRRRWRDELDSFNKDWSLSALDRERWKESREAFAQQWDAIS